METYRKQVIENDAALSSSQHMIIIWDVYCRHRDGDLLKWIRKEFPFIIILFVPANMTEVSVFPPLLPCIPSGLVALFCYSPPSHPSPCLLVGTGLPAA